MDQFPLYNSTRQLENRIVISLLEQLGEIQVEYPPDLFENRRIIFATQLDETIKSGHVAPHPDSY